MSIAAAIGLWALVEAVELLQPFKDPALPQLLAVELVRSDAGAGAPWALWFAGPRYGGPVDHQGRLEPNRFGVALKSVDLRLPLAEPARPGFLVLELARPAGTFAELQARYPGAVPIPPNPGPPGDAGDLSQRPWSYRVRRGWGFLTFGVLRDQVVSVVFDPAAPTD
jgi:hypothetical protein